MRKMALCEERKAAKSRIKSVIQNGWSLEYEKKKYKKDTKSN